MDCARSIALGGKTVYADNFLLRHLHVSSLLLRCSFCGEPVFFKDGYEKKPHFSHYPDIPTRILEECKLRQKSHSYNSCSGSALSITSGREQRLEIFEARFINIFKQGNPEFNDRVQFVSDNLENSEEMLDQCKQFFIFNVHDSIEDCREMSKKIHRKVSVEQTTLREQILLEALDYLAVKGAEQVLLKVIRYNLCEAIYRQRKSKKPEYFIFVGNDDELYERILSSIVRTPWLEAFQEIQRRFEALDLIGGSRRGFLYRDQDEDEQNTKKKKKKRKKKRPQKKRGGNQRVNLFLSPAEYADGCVKTFQFTRLVNTGDDQREPKTESLTVNIPPCEPGKRFRIVGHGNEGINGGATGDLMIHIFLEDENEDD